jgi:glucoamylase
LWYTLSAGIVNEVYYPTIDSPQLRDIQFLITDGRTFFHDERRDLHSTTETISPHALGFRLTNTDPGLRYRITKEVIADPTQSCLLQSVRLETTDDLGSHLRLYVLCAPHLEDGGWANTGRVITSAGKVVLSATKSNTWLALAADAPFRETSVGFVGVNDGWQDLADNMRLDRHYDCAEDGNIALTGEIDLDGRWAAATPEDGPFTLVAEFVLALAFSDCARGAETVLLQALGADFDGLRRIFIRQWEDECARFRPLERVAGDGGRLYRASQAILLAHEDKLYPGAMIASLSIPWGESRGDAELGGYHLVWTRDLVNCATALLAADDSETPRRALIYLAATQRPDGGFHQNFWITGEPYWQGVQLDETAFPVLLAWRLHKARALERFDPLHLISAAAGYLIREGPASAQERWEEAAGFSPSTLAVTIAALTCAAHYLSERGDAITASFVQEYADYLERNVERWTVTETGTLVPEVRRHYIRVLPADPSDPEPGAGPDTATLTLANQPPSGPYEYPAREIVDAGFLELVRWGMRRPGDPLIEDSLRVVDALLKADLPEGPCWRRYNHDGYGQARDGGPFTGWGVGRPWPLLTGERAHYELAAGRPVGAYLRALEGFAHGFGLLPEQVWDGDDLPEHYLRRGRPTGSAMPLMWAHAEYVKLLRSVADGRVFDLIPEVWNRYVEGNPNGSGETSRRVVEIWKPNHHVTRVSAGSTLRVQAPGSFRVHWSLDSWVTVSDTESALTSLGIGYVDIPVPRGQTGPLVFTLYRPDEDRWEGRDYSVDVRMGWA